MIFVQALYVSRCVTARIGEYEALKPFKEVEILIDCSIQ